MTEQAYTQLDLHDYRFKSRLTSWLVEQRRLGIECPEINQATLRSLENKPSLSVHKRADQLLQYTANKSSAIGDAVAFTNPLVTCPAFAWSESISLSEIGFLLNYLKEKSWIQESESTSKNFTLTVNGHTRISEIANVVVESSQVFVAMWFDASTEQAWNEGIRAAIEDTGYEPCRIDMKQHINKIEDEVIAEIRRSRFVVADFTHGDKGARGSVYYEAGFAHGLKIPVIFTCREDMLNKVHFDTSHYSHIVWSSPEELRKKLADKISAVIGDGPNKSE